MKLNPDCVRDILLLVEQETSLEEFLTVFPLTFPDSFKNYSAEEVMYHIKQCELSGFIEVASWYRGGGCLIKYLLPDGHQFLEDVRSDNNWDKTKSIATTVGTYSLDALKQIASGVIQAVVKAQLGL